ncbi:MAG: Urease accessory protein UreF, partial [Verrucomicrobiaceae bacterium]|nr:Urease accessory protein UreF [Verrucomicrobiaceae bacterium]
TIIMNINSAAQINDGGQLELSRLLQLASPMLPVGAYSYSQGLEWAIESGAVVTPETAAQWITDAIEIYLCRFELPVLFRMRRAWDAENIHALKHWNEFYCAGRDTAEARAETLQMGYSLVRLLDGLDLDTGAVMTLARFVPVSFPLAYSCATSVWNIPARSCLHAYVWSWAENQVSAAMKTIPLGQMAGQRMLLEIGAQIPQAVNKACELEDEALSNFAPGLSIAGSRHETQYSRLFRS